MKTTSITITILLFLSYAIHAKEDIHLIQATVNNSALVKGQFLKNYPIINIPNEKTIALDLTKFKSDFKKYYNIYNEKNQM